MKNYILFIGISILLSHSVRAETCADILQKKFPKRTAWSVLNFPLDFLGPYSTEFGNLKRAKRLYRLLKAAENFQTDTNSYQRILNFYGQRVDNRPLITYDIERMVVALNRLNYYPALRKECTQWGFNIKTVFRDDESLTKFERREAMLITAYEKRQEGLDKAIKTRQENQDDHDYSNQTLTFSTY